MNSFTVRMARWSARHPWRAIVGWLVFVALCLGACSAVGTNSATTADYRAGRRRWPPRDIWSAGPPSRC